MSEASQPPMAWRYCGNQIKLWRTQAGVTREELGKAANYEPESVKSMEQGRRRPTLRLLEVADEMCDARGLLVAAAEFLRPERFPSYSQDFTDAESKAIALHWYETLLIPGLLQTEEYARTLISSSCPPLDDETVAERVAGRLQRQERLKRCPTALFGFVIYEAALHSLVGGASAMKRQLHHLLEIGKLRNVAIQVLPVGREAYPGLSGSLVLLETVDHDQFAYVEGQETGVLYADPVKVSALTQRHGMIRMQALSVQESAQFIRKVAEEL
ncbi:helix-turn-helix transcriptional regulator [Kitasatospora sp. MAP5-34]|uniref:helix-turn-helix domain-containing protein n=1 Tax=Kitasatospora sp. MAP5-34 TaxID=3035102 RepID=UPI002473DDA3|nr:helix-turn-helix transcriptional regulator [Kitasatospora sp. MAP5-34]MDH6575729.1 transcriptional regulator with XRE-family HTH domain [Kitasatospora sp. MAP5-34]